MPAAAKAGMFAGIGEAIAIGFDELSEFAIVLVVAGALAGEKRAQAVMEVVIPLRVQAATALLARADQPGIVVGAFRDQKNLPFEPRRGAMDFGAEIFEKSHRRMIANRVHGVQAQRVDVEFTDPI